MTIQTKEELRFNLANVLVKGYALKKIKSMCTLHSRSKSFAKWSQLNVTRRVHNEQVT